VLNFRHQIGSLYRHFDTSVQLTPGLHTLNYLDQASPIDFAQHIVMAQTIDHRGRFTQGISDIFD